MDGKQKFGLITGTMLLLAIGIYAATSATATVHFVVPSSYDFSVAYDSNITGSTFYFVENDGTIDGSQDNMLPYAESAATNLAQGAADDQNLMTITVTGTSAIDLNYFWNTTLPTGVEYKAWRAADAGGCGADGLGGCEASCSVSGDEDEVTTTTCKNVTSTATPGVKVIDNLASGAKRGLCACAKFTSKTVGDDSRTLNMKSGN